MRDDSTRRSFLGATAMGLVGTVAASETVRGVQNLRSISYGQTRSGEIDSTDPTGYYGHYEPVEFEASEGDVVTVTMESGGDTRLILLDPTGQEIAENDDYDGDFNSQIDRIGPLTSGTYTIIATTYSEDSLLEYNLSLEQTGTQTPTQGADLRSISYGQTRFGEIDSTDPTGYYGHYEPVEFEASEGDVVTATMESGGDTRLILLDPTGQVVAENDDYGGGLNSQIDRVGPLTSGTYTIVATTYTEDSLLEYNLSLEQTGTQTADLRSISYGQTRSGEVDSTDPTGYYGHYEPVEFEASEGDVVTVTMESGGDTRLILLDPTGQEIAENDDYDGDLNSQISEIGPLTSGTYTIVATTYSEDSLLEYSLSLERADRQTPTDLQALLCVENTSVGEGESVSLPVVISSFDSSEGFAGADIELQFPDNVTPVDVAANSELAPSSGSISGQNVQIRASDGQNTFDQSDGQLLLAQVTVRGTDTGEGTVELVDTVVDDDDGRRVDLLLDRDCGQLATTQGCPTVEGVRTTDPDGDGVCEDVNGNRRTDFDDVNTLFDNLRSSDLQENADAFDFNDNGRIDFDDVNTLFNEIG